jgi:hypothetical protein
MNDIKTVYYPNINTGTGAAAKRHRLAPLQKDLAWQAVSQPDMFGGTPVTSHSTSPLIGLAVQLQRTVDRPCECGGTAAIIGQPKGPHVGALYCASCQKHRSWLPKTVACFLSETVRVFGKSSSPIIVRDSSNSGPCGPESVAYRNCP